MPQIRAKNRASQIIFAVGRNIHVSLISGAIEFHNHDVIIESSSSHALDPTVPFSDPVFSRWPSFPFPFRNVRTNWDHFRYFFPFSLYVAWIFWSFVVLLLLLPFANAVVQYCILWATLSCTSMLWFCYLALLWACVLVSSVTIDPLFFR